MIGGYPSLLRLSRNQTPLPVNATHLKVKHPPRCHWETEINIKPNQKGNDSAKPKQIECNC